MPLLEDKRVRRLLLLLLGVGILLLLARLPGYRQWLGVVVSYYRQVPRHLTTRDYDQRMYDRLGFNYLIGQQLRDVFLKPGDILLLPPADYVRQNFDDTHWNWAEPKFFYYLVGRQRTVTLTSPDVRAATCTVIIDEQGQPQFVRFETPADLARAIALFAAWQS